MCFSEVDLDVILVGKLPFSKRCLRNISVRKIECQ